MGKPGKTARPKLPHGPHRELLDLLHGLLAESHLSMRGVARYARVSPATVHNVLSTPAVPSAKSTNAVAAVLADYAVRNRSGLSRDEREEALDTLLDAVAKLRDAAARQADSPHHPVLIAANKLWQDTVDGRGAVGPDLYPDTWDALNACHLVKLRFHSPSGLLVLSIGVPDDEETTTALTDPFPGAGRKVSGARLTAPRHTHPC